MRLIYKVGDLTKAPEYCIAHGCNAQGVMGSGVAKAIREAFPDAYRVYRSYYESQHGLQLGANCYWDNDEKLIVNMITQDRYGKDGRRYVNYEAIATCLEGVDHEGRTRTELQGKPYDQNPFDSVALPKIGAGLGGGDWKVIRAIIESSCKFLQPVVYVMNESEIDD